MHFTSIDQLGPALAPAESPERLDSRAAFLRKLGLGAGVVVGGGLLLGRPGVARAGHGDQVADADVLQYALTLEYLEASFYTQALGGQGTTGVPASSAKFSRGAINGSRLFKIFGGRIRSTAHGYLSAIRNHEVAHVNFLRAGLTAAGATPVPPATFNFSAGLGSVGAFLKTAQLLENTGVMAYDGAIRYVDTGDFLQAGAQIATV
ncbi:MAG: ferritin-like domain-containing protein, partial [Actinomycetota bacterium]|nr:ferritin-like domain-containing protein [Actinomycetota bacterium]